MQGQEEALLQGQLASLHDRMHVQEHVARDDEKRLCQKLIDEELKQRDDNHQALMNSKMGLLQH
eukprot:3362186-Prorocentrum_lima.AAC.1